MLIIGVLQLFVLSLYCEYRSTDKVMKQTVTLKLSLKEAELINLMRNYKRAYPNGHPNLYWAIQEMVDALINPFE